VTVKICVSLATSTVYEIPPLIKKAESMGADFAEIRLDHLRSLDGIEKVPRKTNVPLIATNRQYESGGKNHQRETERIETLLEAAQHGFSYADIELNTPKAKAIIRELTQMGVKPIVSFHHFSETPPIDELRKITSSEINVGADICKLVTTANKMVDNLPCLSLVSEMSQKTKIVCFAMGKEGLLSRTLSPLFGACFTYASLGEGSETAPGQPSIQHLRQIYKHLGV
jgi:3-dehydroquinate dehydratase-1